MKNILLIGGGGHCASVADVLLRTNVYDKIGIVVNDDSEPLFGTIPIVGCDDDLESLRQEYDYGFVTVGSISNTNIRQKLLVLLQKYNYSIPNIVDPSAEVSQYAKLGVGIFIGKNTVINARSQVDDGVIVNTGSVIEHDCRIHPLTHISPSATLCGAVSVGAYSHIGAGATVIQGIHIGMNVIVGAGTVVIHDLPDGVKAVGNPARIIEKR
jgi:sugar O-acyltransferase (sialic acid O-acetyltransferase NeuD family)